MKDIFLVSKLLSLDLKDKIANIYRTQSLKLLSSPSLNSLGSFSAKRGRSNEPYEFGFTCS